MGKEKSEGIRAVLKKVLKGIGLVAVAIYVFISMAIKSRKKGGGKWQGS